jgi:hypothetical protein
MRDCLLIVDANERFSGINEHWNGNEHMYDYSNLPLHEFCDNNGYIYLLCKYDPTRGIIYNDHLIFNNNEFIKYLKEDNVNSDYNPEDVSADEHNDSDTFYMLHKVSTWYYFFCTPSLDNWTQKDMDYISPTENRVLVKPQGFLLYKNDKPYKIGYEGAHVHLYISK